MKSLGNILLSVRNDKYSINFKYASPRKIDLFELTLMEIIKHGNNFPEQNIEQVLEMMEMPKDFHYYCRERLLDFIKKEIINFAGVIHYSIIYMVEEGDDSKHTSSENILSENISLFSLTQSGEEAYFLQEVAEEPKPFSGEYMYEIAANRLVTIPKENITNENECFVVDLSQPNISIDDEESQDNPENANIQIEIQKRFTEIIRKNLKVFVKTGEEEKTQIFDLNAAHSGTIGKHDTITIVIDEERGKISFQNNNKEIRQAFLNATSEEKQQLRDKNLFNYFDIPQTQLDFEKAKIAKPLARIKMKAAFGEEKAIKAIAEGEYISIAESDLTELNKIKNFCFAGIDEKGIQFVYNYCEINEAGFEIPLETRDNTLDAYTPIFRAFSAMYISKIETFENPENIARLIILASPQNQRMEVIKAILNKTDDLSINLKNADIILNVIKNDEKVRVMVNERLMNLIKNNLTGKEPGIGDVNKIVEILKTYSFLPRKSVIKLLADSATKSDEIINVLLGFDEKAVIDVYELGKLYNSFLKTDKLHSISHNTNLYAIFNDYYRQFKKLQSLGLKNYYAYDVPEDWDSFMKEVKILKEKFEQIRPHLDNDIAKQAKDFFERVQDDYYASSSVDIGEEFESLKPEPVEIKKGIYDAKSDDQLVGYAGLLRSKYEEYLRREEKLKDPHVDGSRKGKNLIDFVLNKSQNDCYTHWRNLNIILHMEKDNTLWKGELEKRRIILILAFDFFTKELENRNNDHIKKEKGEKK